MCGVDQSKIPNSTTVGEILGKFRWWQSQERDSIFYSSKILIYTRKIQK